MLSRQDRLLAMKLHYRMAARPNELFARTLMHLLNGPEHLP